ncbi:MAG: VanZ family protein [Methylovulum sp.]|nr:VanZ family protein [Methylovulum sp.]
MIRLLVFLGLLVYCLFIYWLSAQPSLDAPMWFEHQDKVYHAGAYFIMALLAWLNFKQWVNGSRAGFYSVAFCSLYGISDEWHQSFVVGRSADVSDWLADTSGAGLAMFLQLALRNSNKC